MGTNVSVIRDNFSTAMTNNVSQQCSVVQLNETNLDITDSNFTNCSNVSIDQQIQGTMVQCDESIDSSQISSISSAIQTQLQNSQLNLGQTNISNISETVAQTFLNNYNSSCSALSNNVTSNKITGITVDCCAQETVEDGILVCQQSGTFSVNQQVIAPQLDCAISAAITQAAAMVNQQAVTETNTGINPFDIIMGLVGLVLVIVIGIVAFRALKKQAVAGGPSTINIQGAPTQSFAPPTMPGSPIGAPVR